MRRVRAVLRLARWPNVVLASGGVLAGAWSALQPARWPRVPVVGATLAAAALTVLANAFNDYRDLQIDRVAHPDRPLPAAVVPPSWALRMSQVGAVAAVATSLAVGPALAMLTVVVVAAMLWYSIAGKTRGMPGNVTVALLASLPFLYGAWAVGRPAAAGLLVALAVPLHLARELAKDIEDAVGDAGHRRTVPVRHGAAVARALALAALGGFTSVLIIGAAAWPGFLPRSVPAILIAAAAGVLVATGRRGAPALLKVAMIGALIALVATPRPGSASSLTRAPCPSTRPSSTALSRGSPSSFRSAAPRT